MGESLHRIPTTARQQQRLPYFKSCRAARYGMIRADCWDGGSWGYILELTSGQPDHKITIDLRQWILAFTTCLYSKSSKRHLQGLSGTELHGPHANHDTISFATRPMIRIRWHNPSPMSSINTPHHTPKSTVIFQTPSTIDWPWKLATGTTGPSNNYYAKLTSWSLPSNTCLAKKKKSHENTLWEQNMVCSLTKPISEKNKEFVN